TGRERERAILRGDLVLRVEVELAAAPLEHARDHALDVVTAHGLELAGPGLRREARLTHERVEVRRLALELRGVDEAVAEHDAAPAFLAAQHEHPGLPGQAHDLEDVGEAEVLEASDQAHALPPAPTRAAAPDRVGRRPGRRALVPAQRSGARALYLTESAVR